jgi:hypothetical protein
VTQAGGGHLHQQNHGATRECILEVFVSHQCLLSRCACSGSLGGRYPVRRGGQYLGPTGRVISTVPTYPALLSRETVFSVHVQAPGSSKPWRGARQSRTAPPQPTGQLVLTVINIERGEVERGGGSDGLMLGLRWVIDETDGGGDEGGTFFVWTGAWRLRRR